MTPTPGSDEALEQGPRPRPMTGHRERLEELISEPYTELRDGERVPVCIVKAKDLRAVLAEVDSTTAERDALRSKLEEAVGVLQETRQTLQAVALTRRKIGPAATTAQQQAWKISAFLSSIQDTGHE